MYVSNDINYINNMAHILDYQNHQSLKNNQYIALIISVYILIDIKHYT
jgi:hypothetical protein